MIKGQKWRFQKLLSFELGHLILTPQKPGKPTTRFQVLQNRHKEIPDSPDLDRTKEQKDYIALTSLHRGIPSSAALSPAKHSLMGRTYT